jgi:hypothetical protein
MSQLELLRSNLNRYISKFYLRQMLQGMVATVLFSGSAWLLVAAIEYYSNFQETTRALLFFSFLTLLASLSVMKIALPLGRLLGILKTKKDTDAANEIGKSVQSIDDKLLNVLNLESHSSQNVLVRASLLKNSELLNRVNFSEIIGFRSVIELGKFLLLPIALFFLLLIVNPNIISDGSKRVLAYNTSFIPPAPFEFILENDNLIIAEGDDFSLSVTTKGNQLPDQVFIETSEGQIRMKKLEGGLFSHVFENLKFDQDFKLSAAGVLSPNYKISVLASPKLLRNRAYIDYPTYTGLKDEELINRSQLKVAEGSTIRWTFDLKNTTGASMLNNASFESLTNSNGTYHFEDIVKTDKSLMLVLRNDEELTDSSMLSIFVVKDQYPSISALELVDTNSSLIKYFSGEIRDDYGFGKLTFNAAVKNNGRIDSIVNQPVKIALSINQQPIHFIFDLNSITLTEGQSIEYYFEIWDNDGVNGSKSTRSQTWTFRAPTAAELNDKNNKQADQSKTAMDNQLSELKKMDKELEQLRKDLLEKKKADWQDKEKMKEMMEKQQKMMEKVMEKALQQRKQNQLNKKFNPYSQELLNKQEQIQKLFDELFDEEFKEKYEKYKQMLEQLNKEQMLDKVDEMKLDNEQLEKELDRTLELFKELELEKKVEDIKTQAEKLSKEQEDLMKKTEEKNVDSERLKEEQDQLSEQLKELQSELEKLDKLNQELESPKDLPNTDQEKSDAEEGMKQSSEELKKNNKKKAKEKQKEAKEALDELGEKMESFQNQQSQEKHTEDLDDMRQLLENLVDLSKNQESVMEELKTTRAKDPRYVQLAKAQKDLIDDTKVVEDSLLALSKRVPQISNTINDEISGIKQTMNKSLDNLTNQQPNQEKRYTEVALVNQQLSMTSLNNLAILFDDIIQQMQKEMNSEMKGSGQCEKPGNGKSGKPSASDMKKMQENLNKQLQKLKDAMEKGENPNGKNPGSRPGMGQTGMSKELAQMAAEQGAIRDQLRELSNAINQQGGKPGTEMKEIQKLMEQTEEDLLFQNITQETINRQQKILTKLLESEKAERERERDDKRESKEPTVLFDVPFDIWENYKMSKENELELFKTLPPNLKPFYRNEVNRYFSEFAE